MIISNSIRHGPRSLLALECECQMDDLVMIKRPFVTALFLTLSLFIDEKSAQAEFCLGYEGAYGLEARMQEGLSLKQAQQRIVEDEYSDGSAACWSAIKQEINQMPYAFPLAHRALYKRMRR